MTTYAQDEASQADGDVTELYKFTGSATTWYYTSGIAAVTFAMHSYVPLAGLVRGPISKGSTFDARPLQVTLPTTAEIVQHYAFALPPRSLRLLVTRMQALSGESETIWDGEVTGITPNGPVAVVTSPSPLGAKLLATVPAQSIRPRCNHRLGDEHCRVDLTAAGRTTSTTVATVSADGYTITVAGVGGHIDHYFRAGVIVRDSDGEQRTIKEQVGTTLTLALPFRTLASPNPVTLTKGCDHTSAMCVADFDNLDNFGGFENVPRFNPHRVPIKLGRDS